jgi:hypothetical protein
MPATNQALDDARPAYIWFDKDTRRFLVASGVKLENLVEKINLEGLSVGKDPAAPQNAKDAFMILVGSAAVIATATPIILKLIERLTLKPVIVDEIETEAVRDASGDVVRDHHGRPVLVKQIRKRLLEPTTSKKTERKVEFQGAGIQFGIADQQET